MPNASPPDLTPFLDILLKLEALDIPYVVIGGFAAAMYGITRVTYDIDIIVDMGEEHIQSRRYRKPIPCLATILIPAICDGLQMRRASEIGSSFNIIDVERGEKADLIPLSMDRRNEPAFEKRIRRTIDMVRMDPFSIWVARPEDVMVGKLMAWQEGRSGRHTADISEMLLFHTLGERGTETEIDEAYVGERARQLGEEVAEMWEQLILQRDFL